MKRNSFYRIVLSLVLFTIRPVWGLGNNGGPARIFNFAKISGLPLISDSIPKTQKPADDKTSKPPEKTGETVDEKTPDIIKGVPKARRQIKPVAVPAVIPVKPIKIIKPKIIRNTIKVLH